MEAERDFTLFRIASYELINKRYDIVVDKRPVNLDISTIRLPITALASITHRISGVILLGAVLILLWMLGVSLESEQGFEFIRELLDSIVAKLIMWAILSALAYHFVAGIRHMIMDMGFWESLEGGKLSAKISFVLSALLIVLAGVWIW